MDLQQLKADSILTFWLLFFMHFSIEDAMFELFIGTFNSVFLILFSTFEINVQGGNLTKLLRSHQHTGI